jgi:parvulin-like peptidyl-prolyl isomerase
VAWLGVGQVMSILGPSGNVVLRVNRKEYPVTEYQQRVQAASEQYRQQNGTAPLTKEEDRQLQDQVINQMIQDALLEQEYRRLGIRVSDDEIVAMAHNSPLPEIMRDPQFQTDGEFDIRKWQQFLSTTSDRNLLLQLEAIYRQQIPRIKLFEYLASDVYIPDAKLWRLYKDQHDSVRVTSLVVSPVTVLDTTPISDAELQAYIVKHPDDFKRPGVAAVRFIAIPRLPNAADSAAARAHVARVRSELARGAKFEDVAKRESSDSGSGQRGGDLGWIKKNDSTTFVAPFMQAVRSLKPGQLSAPVASEFGYHLIRVDQAKGDSVKVRHILIPVALQGPHLDQVEARADTLERLAAERSDPTTLDTVARRMGLQVSPEYRVVEGQGFRLGEYRIPDVSVWAFEAPVSETSPVIEGESGYYVFRLDSVTPAGTPPLAQIRARVTDLVRVENLKTRARHRADSLATLVRGVPDLATAASAHGLPVQRLGPFTRMRPPRDLSGEPFVVGSAFGLRIGERSGVVEGEAAYFILESLGRKFADSTAWLAQKEVQRTQLRQALQQGRIQLYLEGVRAKAKIVDRRKDLFKSQPSADALLN